MKIVVLKESPPETRIAMTPQVAQKLVKLGVEVEVEVGLGEALGFTDASFFEAGATLKKDRRELLQSADIILRVQKPTSNEISLLKKGALYISFLNPFEEGPLLSALKKQGALAISLQMLPRTTLAQKMDALSSQASLAGYAAVIEAAKETYKVFPMMTTPAGTISPVKVFVVGAGVAGLQAIATAKRLGAIVEAFDTRPVVEEQVKSLGAKFLKIDLGEIGQTKEGYAKPLTEEQLAKQQEAMAKSCAEADIVITTAQVFGKKAPLLITQSMITKMSPGSVIVDLAIESGGNVQGSKLGETIVTHGVKILGIPNLPGTVAQDASKMYAGNLYHLLHHLLTKGKEDPLFKDALICS